MASVSEKWRTFTGLSPSLNPLIALSPRRDDPESLVPVTLCSSQSCCATGPAGTSILTPRHCDQATLLRYAPRRAMADGLRGLSTRST